MQWQHQLVCAAHERRRRTVRAAREVGRPHSSSQVRSSPLISLVHSKYMYASSVHVNNLSSDSVVEDGFDVFIPHDAVSADECAVEVRLPLNSTRVVVVSVQVNILQCMFWSEREDLWRTSGCVVSAQHHSDQRTRVVCLAFDCVCLLSARTRVQRHAPALSV